MLVLSRKKGESIMIGEQVEIVVLSSEGDNVRIGIKAPKHIQVYRHEVYQAIKESNKQASEQLLNPKSISDWLKKR
ncbi:carbon storage regulator, CsrA [Paenibacillus sp. UNCCL117]|uniref:carbon storage regulator CsrA n=1 Tax=unclassified Paenibacillus TaxID=185978 RepID=UPI000890741B|nr:MULTISPECIES: carbon storage regulator CsrA [unclassified Paenibacillus]SDE50287.1 carbon storage regulator, CsrA [Paenibacillus sp. cl123]SFW67393.1 carbon storage regulator, CsrA [Paenibacillus sp. UNCCL117]